MRNLINGKPEVNAVIGMGVKEAYEHLMNNEYKMRIVQEDGKSPMVSADFVSNRVNVIVEGNKVINISNMG